MPDELTYRSAVEIDALGIGECTIRRAVDGDVAYWRLWFCVARDSDAQVDVFSVPIHPGGGYEATPRWGKTWGFQRTGDGAWQVSPSINVLGSRDPHPGEHPEASLWHHTPLVIGVPDGEIWQSS